MNHVLSADGLLQIGVVVSDFRYSIREFSKFFGIAKWEVRTFSCNGSTTLPVGTSLDHSYVSAIGTRGDVSFEIIQPRNGNSQFSDFLSHRGEGVYHLLTNRVTKAEFEVLRSRLAHENIAIAQSDFVGQDVECHYLATSDLIGGVVIKVEVFSEGASAGYGEPDEIIEFDDTITRWNPLPTQKIFHACIVTNKRRDEVRDSLQNLLGIENWFNFENESGVSAQDTTCYGRTCQIAFNLALGRRGGLALEVVETNYGYSSYSEWLEERGEGIHHLMTTLCSSEKLNEYLPWFHRQGVPLIMGGDAGEGDFCYYGYLDTRKMLAGLTVEVLCPAGPDWLVGREDAGKILLGED